jgi:phospholipid/cholesterol/gamma-HCH transport system permease protein
MNEILGSIGRKMISTVSIYAGLLSLLFYAFKQPFSSKARGNHFVYPITIQQIFFTGVQAISLISLIAVALGAAVIIMLQSNGKIDLNQYLGIVLVYAIVRLLGPVITAIIVIARSGTAMATEIANMVIRNEILALETMAIDTMNFIVLPRLLGMALSLICLNVCFDLVSIIGGMGIAKIVNPNMDIRLFIDHLFTELNFGDILGTVVKSVFFGFGIALICMINGFKVLLYPGGVPVSGIKGVVGSLQYVFVVNAVLTVIFLISG